MIANAVGNFPGRACVVKFDEWENRRVDDVAVRPDGSHYEWRDATGAGRGFADSVVAVWEGCNASTGLNSDLFGQNSPQ